MNYISNLMRRILNVLGRLSLSRQKPADIDQDNLKRKASQSLGKTVNSQGQKAELWPPARKAPQSLGKMFYSSKTQAELEREEGEKLYRVSEGVYVNQVTHDLIQSEQQPVIENEPAEDFLSHQYEFSGAICATWHPNDPKLLCVAVSPTNLLTCLSLNVDRSQITKVAEEVIVLPNKTEQIKAVAHHPFLSYLLITCVKQLFIWDYIENKLIASIDLDGSDVKDGGFYPAGERAWTLTMSQHRTGYNWVIWDYSVNKINQYQLQRHDHYGRGATLHPSGLLIGAAWNAYECGYLIHTAEPKPNDLYYYSQPAPERSEYEAYSPCFSPDGRRIALVVNPYLAMHKNHSKVCVYDVETAELGIEFYTGTSLNEEQLQFAHGGATLTFRESDSNNFHIFDAKSSKRIRTLNTPSNIKYLTAHRLFGYYAAIHDTGISVFFPALQDTEKISDYLFSETSTSLAKRFIAANAKYLVQVSD